MYRVPILRFEMSLRRPAILATPGNRSQMRYVLTAAVGSRGARMCPRLSKRSDPNHCGLAGKNFCRVSPIQRPVKTMVACDSRAFHHAPDDALRLKETAPGPIVW